MKTIQNPRSGNIFLTATTKVEEGEQKSLFRKIMEQK